MDRMRFALLHLTALALAACGAGPQDGGAADTPAPQRAAAEAPAPTLYGRWTIVAVNGAAPIRLGGEHPAPYLLFARSSYGGSSGCNSFGGTGLLVGDRWFGELPMSTAMGCGTLDAQERAIMAIAAGSPVVRFQDGGEAILTSKAGTLRLRREADPDRAAPNPAPMPLAGTGWLVRAIDGVRPVSRPNWGTLIFEAERWTLDGPCGPLAGSWRQAGEAVTMDVASPTPSACAPAARAADGALRAMIAAAPRYTTGPNRELVMGGGAHWLTGDFDRNFGKDAPASLRGEWRIVSVDGIAPAAGPRPPSLAFGAASYALWDGCNHSEGLLLIQARHLFTRGSGLSTLAQCAPDPTRARVRAIVAGHPRIAKTDGGGLALVAPAGTLRLARLSATPFGSGETLGLRAPRTIILLDPDARLTLTSKRFTIQLSCGRIEGQWRGGQPARFSTDPTDRSAPGCAQGPGSDAFRLSQFFNGDVHAVTGPNRDIVLLVNEEQSLAGRAGS